MRKILAICALSFHLSPAVWAAPADRDFEEMAKKYTEEYLHLNPEDATRLGDHRFDHLLNDYSKTGIDKDLALSKWHLEALKEMDPGQLSAANRLDFMIFRDALESRVLELTSIKEYTWNPVAYNGASPIYALLAREYAPLKTRLLSVKSRLEKIHEITDNAKVNLINPPKIHTETAIQQNKGSISFIKEELEQFLKQAPELRAEIAPAQAAAVKALEDYGVWLEKDLLPRSTGEFRLGEEKFKARLRYSLGSNLSKEEILQRAEADLKTTQDSLYATALPLYAQFYPEKAAHADPDHKGIIKAVLDKLAEKHPTDKTIVEAARRDLAECTEFVRTHRLVTLPREPVQIIVMPEFNRGVAVAYCDAPGALAHNEATFYAISPTPADWTQSRKDSFYREYNDYMLKNLTVHEAVPGHYVQLAHANHFKAPTQIRAIFQSGIFAEGWATYGEQLMASKGFGGPEVKMQQLKMRLRLIINAILDQKIHTAGMTESEAMDLMTKEGFQEEGEAAGKWRRACLTATQLSTYFVGNLEVNELVKSYQAFTGKSDLQAAHDKILSYGSVPPKYLKAALETTEKGRF